jgi:hypothetical protein
MTVKEFFANLNRIADYNVYIRDISSNTEQHNSVNALMENEDLYNDWKDATILSWCVIDNEFIMTVQKYSILCEVMGYLFNMERKAESMPDSDAKRERMETLHEVMRYTDFLLKDDEWEDE